MKTFQTLIIFMICSQAFAARDYKDACIKAILRGDVKKELPLEYNEKFDMLIETKKDHQWVYLDTGAALTDKIKTPFICVPKVRNPKRDLGLKIHRVFNKIYKTHKEKGRYVDTLLTPCRKTKYSVLKARLNNLADDSELVERRSGAID